MKRKITDLALGAKWGCLGARGLADLKGVAPSAATAWDERKPSLERRSRRPSEVKPAPACQRNSRRVRWQKVLEGLVGMVTSSYHGHLARAGFLIRTGWKPVIRGHGLVARATISPSRRTRLG